MKQIFTKLMLVGLAPLGIYGQTIVSTTPENKKAILEEFTGIHCQYCPAGHAIAEQILESNPGNAFAINIHEGVYAVPGSGQPDFRTPFGTAIAGQTGLTGYPAGTVNRHVFSGSNTTLDRGAWASRSSQIVAMPSYLNMAVEASIDIDTRQLIVHVESYYTGASPQSTNFINVALLQNNTLGPQTGGNQGNNYNHMRRLVHLITGQWGEEITTTSQGSFVDKTYTYSIPESYNNIPTILSNMEIVVFMTETHQEIISGNGAFPSLIGLEFQNDASVKSIHEIPNTCSGKISPIIEIENLGGDIINSLTFEYSVNSEETHTYTWTGNIAPLSTSNIELPEMTFNIQSANTINVSIPDDENNSNNEMSREVMIAKSTDSNILTLEINTDGSGSQTRWYVRDSNDELIVQGYGYSSNQTYTEEIELSANDCYTFGVIDGGNNGGATFTLKDQDDVVLIESDGNYGSGFREEFSKGALGIDDQNEAEFSIYPNPTSGILNISTKAANNQIEIFDATGKKVYAQKSNNQLTTVDLSGYGKGIYIIKIDDGKKATTKKIILK